GDDEDLSPIAARAARRLHVVRNGVPQFREAGRVAVVELPAGHPSKAPADQLRPQSKRKEVEGRRAEPERPRRSFESVSGTRYAGQPGAAARQLRMFGPRAARQRLPRQIIRQLVRDERPRSVARGEISLRDQLLVREQRGGSGDLQVLGERSRRRQARARSENSFEDPAADALIELRLQSLSGMGIGEVEKVMGVAGWG